MEEIRENNALRRSEVPPSVGLLACLGFDGPHLNHISGTQRPLRIAALTAEFGRGSSKAKSRYPKLFVDA